MECRQPPAPRLFVYARPARKGSDGASNEIKRKAGPLEWRNAGNAPLRDVHFDAAGTRPGDKPSVPGSVSSGWPMRCGVCKIRLRTNRHSFRAHDARGICAGRESASARAGCVPNRSCLIFGGMCLRRPRSQPVQNAWKRNGFARKHSLPCYLRMR